MNDKSSAIEYLKIENIDIYDTKLITEEFAKHFSSVGSTYANRITKPHTTFTGYLKNIPNNPSSIFMSPTNMTEIETLIEKLPNKTSRGHDDISNILLKKIKSSISYPLEIIFNKSLLEGSFPEMMKQADVTPLHKSKEKYIVNNYRPISLLLTTSKVLEKIVYSRTYKFLCNSNQLYESQYGFRTAHSCENAICELVGTIAKNREERKHTIGVFIDLSKAFDTLNHHKLLLKMEKYGIRGTNLQWFKSYLANRSMRVKCTSNITGHVEYSTYHKLEYGTPQGSCLGPLLFLIYINDLQNSILYSTTILFADDTTLLQGHQNLKYLKWSVEEDLKLMIDWFRANLLTINLDKTECLLFNKNNCNSPLNLELELGTSIIKCTDQVKFLGLWIDNKLQWTHHTNTLLMKLKQNTNLLKVGNKFLSKASKKLVYYAHIYSHLTYGIVIWGNMTDSVTKRKIQKCMDTCFNLITHMPPTPVNYKKENMLNLKELILLENTKLSFKLQHHLLPIRLHNMLSSDSRMNSLEKIYHYETRNKDIPKLPSAKTKDYHTSFLFQSLRDYEMVPLETRNCITLSTFIIKMKRRLLKL